MIFFNSPIDLVYIIPILLFSVALHEASHATIAYLLGDKSQRLQGRMTLDPFAHFDLLGFIYIMLVGIGWGKPTFVDDRNFKNRKRDNMLVSLAGPASNLVAAFVITIIMKLCFIFGAYNFFITTFLGSVIYRFLSLTVIFNVMFAIFNMLPIPPFDGSKVLAFFMPRGMSEKYLALEKYSILFILILLVFNLDSILITPVMQWIINILNFILNI